MLTPPPPAGFSEIKIKPKGEPQPLPINQLKPVPAFDHEKLMPEKLRWWVVDESHRSAAPIEYIAVSALVCACVIISPKIKIQPKRNDSDYQITPNLWGAVIGMPSAKKTPGLKAGMRQLTRIESIEQARMEEERKALQKSKGRLDAKKQVVGEHLKKLLRDQAKNGEDAVSSADIERAEQALEEAEQEANREPIGRRYIVNDVTIEKLGEILNHSPGVLQFRDEMSGWLQSFDREDRHNDRAYFLEAFNGSGSYTYDRIGRGEVRIDQNIVSVLGGIQRDKIKPLVRAAVGGAESNDGLLPRFQMMVYPDYEWIADEDRVPHGPSREKASVVFDKLVQLPALPMPLQFDEEAYLLFRQWQHDTQKRISQGDTPPVMQSHLGKYDKLVASLAGLFCLIDWDPVQQIVPVIRAGPLRMALAWAELLEAHAERVYGLNESADLEVARLLVGRKDKLLDGFTASHVSKSGWSGTDNVKVVADALQLLVDFGHLSVEEQRGAKGGRPTLKYSWV